jgi:ketosteroid isomerase-like protein
MGSEGNLALQTALAYFRAWTSHDFEGAMRYVADDIVCDAPAGRLAGAEAFRGFMGPFAQIVTSSRLLAAFGDDETALLMYDTDTAPVEDAPGAECLTVHDGKITHLRIIFDRLPFTEARREAAERDAAQERRGDR